MPAATATVSLAAGPVRALAWPRALAFAACCASFALGAGYFRLGGTLSESLSAFTRGIAHVVEVFGCILALSLWIGWVTRQHGRWRIAALVVAVPLGAFLGCTVAYGDQVVTASLTFCGFAWAGVALWALHERDLAALITLRAERERLADLGLQLAEAQLQVLKAQVEPHFLFNTLAHVRRLYATQPDLARVLLLDLRQYMSALHPVLQHAAIPLHDDMEYARAYLRLQQLRMGQRLRFKIEAEPAALQVPVPPMTVTTLVENAVKHGLAETTAGGTITVAATARAGGLQLTVSDDGAGLKGGHGTGVGLSNLRARLRSLHGGAASLELQQGPAGGVVASLRIST